MNDKQTFNSKNWLKGRGLTQEKSLEACCKLSLVGLFHGFEEETESEDVPKKRGKHSTSGKKKNYPKKINKVIQTKLNIAETNVKSYI